MNSTQWETLTEFVKYLGKSGVAEVEETPKGWFIKYIDRDPEMLARYEALRKREMQELDDDEIQKRMLEQQIERAKEATKSEDIVYTELSKADDEKISLNLSIKSANQKESLLSQKLTLKSFDDDDDDDDNENDDNKNDKNHSHNSKKRAFDDEEEFPKNAAPPKKKSAVEEIMAQEERKKEKGNRKDYWLAKGIVVKVLNKKLADGAYYKQKGVVKQVHDQYVGEIEMIESADIIKIDQTYCETVIPGVGGRVRIVNGGYRGEQGELVKLNVEQFSATLRIVHGPYNDKIIDNVPYEDFSKLDSEK